MLAIRERRFKTRHSGRLRAHALGHLRLGETGFLACLQHLAQQLEFSAQCFIFGLYLRFSRSGFLQFTVRYRAKPFLIGVSR
jgi:hypothetical protein